MARRYPPLILGVNTDWSEFTGIPSALVDPGGMTTGATGYAAGVFTFEANPAHITVVDGYREPMARYSFPLADLVDLDELDLDREAVEVFLEILSKPAAPAGRHGIVVGLLNADAASYAGTDGAAWGAWYTNALAWRVASVGNTTLGTQVVPSGVPEMLRGTCLPAGNLNVTATGQALYADGTGHRSSADTVTMTAFNLKTSHVHVGLMHVTTNPAASGETWKARVSGRKIVMGPQRPR